MCSPHGNRSVSVRSTTATLITPAHPRWDEFLGRLTAPGCLDVRGGGWSCAGGQDKHHSRRILLAMGLSPAVVAANLAFFEHHGGYCDCEVWMDVERSVARGDIARDGQDEGWGDSSFEEGPLWEEER